KLMLGAGERPLEPEALQPPLLHGEGDHGGLGGGATGDRARRHGPTRIGERRDRDERAHAALPSDRASLSCSASDTSARVARRPPRRSRSRSAPAAASGASPPSSRSASTSRSRSDIASSAAAARARSERAGPESVERRIRRPSGAVSGGARAAPAARGGPPVA